MRHKRFISSRFIPIALCVAMLLASASFNIWGGDTEQPDMDTVCGDEAKVTAEAAGENTEVADGRQGWFEYTEGHEKLDWTNTLEKYVELVPGTDDTFDITLKVTGGELDPKPYPSVVTLVLDYSASMSGQKLTDLQRIANDFVDNFLAASSDNHISVIKYGTRATQVKANGKVFITNTNKQALKTEINKTSTESATNTQAGLILGYQNLREKADISDDVKSNPNTRYYMILMTDGAANTGFGTSSGSGNSTTYSPYSIDVDNGKICCARKCA